MAGVEITVTQGGVTVNAIPVFVLFKQINAIMPSNAPLGLVEVRVICDGQTSAPETVRVVATSVDIFTATGTGSGPGSITDLNFALNTAVNAAAPNQVMIIWATGLHGITGPDNIAPVDAGPLQDFKDEIDIEVFVGGRPVVRIFYAGRSATNAALDQIIVELAPDVALGCFVPVLVVAEGLLSNGVTMATNADGEPCSDPENPLLTVATEGGRFGTIALTRAEVLVDLASLGLAPSSPEPEEKGFGTNIEVTLDTAIASFTEQPPLPMGTFSPFVNLPPIGTCATFSTAGVDVGGLWTRTWAISAGARWMRAPHSISLDCPTTPRGQSNLVSPLLCRFLARIRPCCPSYLV